MEKWEGQVALVTGASSGIGRAIALELSSYGMKVAAVARREQLLRDMAHNAKGKGTIFPYKCDLMNEIELKKTFYKVENQIGQIRVLVNSAGVASKPNFSDFEINKWKRMFDINVFAMFECIKEVIHSVKTNDPGLVHIININSLAGHYTTDNINIYPYAASKHCVTILTKGLIKQIATDNINVRVTSLSPGLVKTDIMKAQNVDCDYSSRAHLQPEDIARAVIVVLQQPDNVIISEITVKPAGELS